jgi:hypothetical protein
MSAWRSCIWATIDLPAIRLGMKNTEQALCAFSVFCYFFSSC